MTQEDEEMILLVCKVIREEEEPLDAELMVKLVPFVHEKAMRISARTIAATTSSRMVNTELLNYLRGGYRFVIDAVGYETAKKYIETPHIVGVLASYIVEHYMTNEEITFAQNDSNLKYNPIYTGLNGILNSMLRGLNSFKRDNHQLNAILDIVNKGFVLSKCVGDLIVGGFETEAFAVWRTLYELTAILTLLVRNEETVIDTYLRHMDYSLAYRGLYYNQEQRDAIFVEIKANMADLGLKSKDMKRYIEYGWIRALPDFHTYDPELRFNFRDGIERAAKLEDQHLWFELASELAHSSPVLIYSNKDYFRDITLSNLYSCVFDILELYKTLYNKHRSEEECVRFNTLYDHNVGELALFKSEIERSLKKRKGTLETRSRLMEVLTNDYGS